jgi:hypothetical protein
LVEPQNQGGGEFSSLGLKTDSYSLVICASKLNRLRFIGCATKLTGGYDGVGYTSRSSGLLRMKASLARVFQSGLKTGGGATEGGAHGTIAEVASKSS